MGSKGAVLSVCGSRNCFIKLPLSWTANVDKNRVQVYKVQTVEGSGVVFTTWQGDTISSTPTSTDIVEINGLYAAKQGLSDGAEVLVNRIENVPTCERLFVEPLSIDDWEILELHAEYLEQHLLDQVRVAWKGQVMPLWVNSKICIFVRVESAEPASDCCLLEQMTELHIAPKDRRRTVTPADKSSAGKPSVKKDMEHPSKSVLESHKKRDHAGGSVPHPEVAHTNPTLPEQGANPQNNEDVFQRLIGYFHNLMFGAKPPDGQGENLSQNELYDEYSYKREILPLTRRLTVSFRTQPCLDPDVTSNNGAGPGGSGREPQVEIPPVQIVHQPTCIYIKSTSFCDTLHKLDSTLNTTTMPSTFLAMLRPSKTPAERDEAINKKMLNKKPLGTEKAKLSQTDSLPAESEMEPQHVVRVVLLDRDNSYTLHGGSGAAIASVRFGGGRGGPLGGHVVVGDLLRRQLSLPATGRVCLQALVDADNTAVPPADVTGITLHPLFTVPAGFTDEMMVMAFKCWIRQVTCLDCPLVVSNGTLIKLFLQQDLFGEFLLTLDYLKGSVLPGVPMYCLLQCGLCGDLTIKVATRMTAANKPNNIQLPCWKLSEIDPKLPAVSLQQLGGVKDLFDELKSHLQVSLAVRPLDAHLMGQHRGQRGGAVLLTGPKGSGKSSLARAVCRSLAELPPLAHVTIIDCKPLRGKRVDAIQKLLNKAFTEAAWRQPSAILLDDLDHIMAAPTGPEQEMSGEAVYFTRVAAVLKDLCQREVMENSAVVVMATCRTQGSLHSALTSSRGHHFCQKVVHINPTDKVQRKAMLEALLAFKSGVKDNCVQGLDLVKVAGQTEGHVVRDLEQIVDRALHALRMNNQEGRRKELQDADFQVALKGFTPMGLRHVTLHDSGDVTWSNIGGLHDVRRALVETLQWPSKYPQLFASCPLRLRAGLLLYGAPGTGKTLLAAAVAKECGLNFISIKGPELLSKYIGASEQAVRDTFDRAQSAKPCILFFDEFDSLAPRRGHDNTGVTDRVVNQLLTQLDGVEGLEGVYVLAATSRPDLIDPALLRPGRLDKALHCTLPTEAERVEILEALSRQMSLADDVNLHKVAAGCNHFTGADLKALLYNAQLAAIHETTDLWGSTLRKSSSARDKPERPKGSPPQKDVKSDELLRNPSFEYLLPENGEVKRERNNSSLSEGSSGSDLSAGQSASWEVVTDVSERTPRAERPVVDKATAAASTSEKPVTERVDGRGRIVAYLPHLEEGVVSVTHQQEEEILSQYQGTSTKTEKKTKSERVIAGISQRHLLEAARTMQPSVSESERRKFSHIYDNFVASKGGGFGGSIGEAGQRATLA